jgi:RNA polymerase sigma-B factor
VRLVAQHEEIVMTTMAIGAELPDAMVPMQAATEADRAWSQLRDLPADHPGRVTARNTLVEVHMPLVHFLARRYAQRGEPLDDLVQVGVVGLIKSIDRFDQSRGVAFSTFATPTIIGELKRHFRDRTWLVRVPRPLQEMRARLVTAKETLSQDLGRSPTIAELARHLDLTEEEVLEGLDAANAYSATSLDAPHDPSSPMGITLEERLGAADDAFELVEKRRCVAPLLDELPERERRIIFLRFFRDKTQAEIGEELGISQMHVSRLLNDTLAKLHARLVTDLELKAS